MQSWKTSRCIRTGAAEEARLTMVTGTVGMARRRLEAVSCGLWAAGDGGWGLGRRMVRREGDEKSREAERTGERSIGREGEAAFLSRGTEDCWSTIAAARVV